MSVYSLVVARVNLSSNSNILKFIKSGFVSGFVRQTRRNFSMQTRVSQKKNYVAVEIPKEAETSTRHRVWLRFRRKETKTPDDVGAVRLKKSDIMRLLSLAKPEKYYLIGAIGFLLVSSSVTMAVPFSIGKVLDIIYSPNNDGDEARAKLNKLCLILVGVFALGGFCNFFRVYLMSASGYRMTQRLRKKVFSSILRQEQGWFDKRSTGELVNRLSSDTQIVGQALSTNISDGLRSIAMVIAGTAMMFYTSSELAIVGLAIVPPVAGIAIVYGRYVRTITKKVQDSLAEATKIAEERIANIKTVKMFGHEVREIKSYDSSIGNVLQIAFKEAKARALFYGMTGITGNTIIISVLYYGGVMISSHSLSVGELSSFLLYAAYIGISIGGLSSFYTEINKSIGAGSRIWEIMDREANIPQTGGIIPIEQPKGRILFQDISFCYPSREDVRIFDKLNFEIKPGQTVAVVGQSGAGKSTLAALLLRLYDPTGGAIFIDDYDIHKLDPVWLKKMIGAVSQEPVLFSTSIKENILYGTDDPSNTSEEKLLEASREANVHEFVQNLPHGYDTLVGERGIMLSGGQKQRVAIARALIKDPKILLLDEATSALDAESEFLVQEALERVMKGRTVLTIAHRLSTIKNADTIAVLKDGQIIETGTYNDLLNSSVVFQKLMKLQAFATEK